MGCCLSTNKTQTKPSKPNSSPRGGANSSSRAPPTTPPAPEEETVVKEVLSETPISRISESKQTKEPLKLSISSPNAKVDHNDVVLEEPKKVLAHEELREEASEICSTLSESCVSTATTATAATADTNNFADDDNDVTQIKNRSPVKYRKRQVSGDRLTGRARSEPTSGRARSGASPGRARPGPVRDGRGQSNNGARRGGMMGPERRSRSPVTRVDGAGSRTGLSRCPSGRRTGKSPGRFGPVEKGSTVERVENPETRVEPANDESLENPHVSLECFIFL